MSITNLPRGFLRRASLTITPLSGPLPAPPQPGAPGSSSASPSPTGSSLEAAWESQAHNPTMSTAMHTRASATTSARRSSAPSAPTLSSADNGRSGHEKRDGFKPAREDSHGRRHHDRHAGSNTSGKTKRHQKTETVHVHDPRSL